MVVAGVGMPHKAGAAVLTAEETVRSGIRRQRVLRLTYLGHTRLVEPHAIGVTTAGHRALLAWQIQGDSKSEPPTGWRTFLIDEIKAPAVTVRDFSPRSTYSREKASLRVEHDVFSNVTAP